MEELDELAELAQSLRESAAHADWGHGVDPEDRPWTPTPASIGDNFGDDDDGPSYLGDKFVQWTTGDDKTFFPAGSVIQKLPSGAYNIGNHPQRGIYFDTVPVKTERLLEFPQTGIERIVREIQTFWSRERFFRQYDLPYKRGILMWGPPGCGKSCAIQLVMRDVVARNGVVLNFQNPSLFASGYRIFREVQPETPAVVMMEDIDAIIHDWDESSVLNILDGVQKVDRVVFLATTNYPERLGARVVNRPSRFDKRFKIPYPNSETRRMYLNNIVGTEVDVEKWVEDTEGFSLAHLKELIVAVIIIGDSYDEALKTLQSMKEETISSAYDEAEINSKPMTGYV